MPAFYTLGKLKELLADVADSRTDLTDALNQVGSRAYDIGRWAESWDEITIAEADMRQDDGGAYDNDWFCYIDADTYDGAVAFKIGRIGYEIKPLSALYHEQRMGGASFIDMGIPANSSVYERRYRMPLGTTNTDDVYAWVKKRWVDLYDDNDKFPIRSLAAIKAGILAVEYENENELQKADVKWQQMENLLLRDDKQFAGNKTQNVTFRYATGRKTTSFR